MHAPALWLFCWLYACLRYRHIAESRSRHASHEEDAIDVLYAILLLMVAAVFFTDAFYAAARDAAPLARGLRQPALMVTRADAIDCFSRFDIIEN